MLLFAGQPLTEAILWSQDDDRYRDEQVAREPCSKVTHSQVGDAHGTLELQVNTETVVA